MTRKRNWLISIGEAFSGTGGPVKELHEASPQARHHFTQADQVHQLVEARETDPDLGFMVRLMALCSLPHTNPGKQHQYKRVNGPYKLVMLAGGRQQAAFRNSAALADGLGFDRGRPHSVSRVGFRELIGRVHGQAGD